MLLLPSHTAAGCDAGLLMVSAKHLAGLIPAAYICSSCCKLCCDRRSGCPATLTSSITDAAPSRLLASCLLHFDCCQGDDVLAALTLLLSPTLCVALGVLCLGAQMAGQHLIAFLSGVLQGRHLGRVSHTTAAVFGMVSRQYIVRLFSGAAVLLVLLFPDRYCKQAECSRHDCASSECYVCFY